MQQNKLIVGQTNGDHQVTAKTGYYEILHTIQYWILVVMLIKL